MNRIRKFVGFLLFAALPSFAFAGTTEFRVLFDTDDDATTGCKVGGLEGVEQVLVTQISDDDSTPRVTRTHRQLCSNNALAAPIDIVTSPWPATWRASDRQLTVETRVPFAAFGSNAAPSGIHVAFDATRNASVHSALANADGTPAVLPETARIRATGAPPRIMILDGALSEWGMISPILFGIQDGGSTALRLVRILTHASQHDNFLYFAAELRIASGSPFADEDTYSREQGAGVTVNAPGVLANDGDPNGQPLTALKVSEPEKGTVTLNPDGSFTYTPNNPHSPGTDQFEYKATTGDEQSNVARVRIKVNNGESPDQSPVNDAYSTDEDETLTVPAPGVLANDPPPLGTAGTAALVTAPSHGTVVLNANGGFVYKPSKNFVGTDTFEYSVTVGGSPLGGNATVTITVESINDSPSLQAATFSIPENSPNGTPVGTVNFSDADNNNLTLSITNGNTGGAFTINPSSGAISVANSTALDFETTPTFSLTVRVQDNGTPSKSATAIITINLTNVNDPPVLTAGGTLTYTENDPPSVINGSLTVTDTDSAQLTGASVTIGNFAAGQDLLSFTPVGAITGVFSGNTLTLSGNDTAANYQTALRSVRYQNTSDNPAGGTRTITWTVTDGALTSTPANSSVNVIPVNDAPVAVADSGYGVNEGGTITNGATVLANDSDAENNTLTAQLVSGPANASSFTLDADGTFDYTHNGGETLSDSFTYRANDGTASSNTVTVSIAINPLNDAPVLTAGGATAVFTEDGAPVAVDPAITVADGDDTNLESATVTITNLLDGSAETLAANTGGTTIVASYLNGVLTLTGSDSVANYQTVLRSVTYTNASQNPTTTARSISFVVNDGTANSNTVAKSVTIVATNDAPVFTSGTAPSVAENTTAVLTITTTDSENDTITYSITGGADAALFTINSTTGALSFLSAPNFEAPADAGANNVYDVVVTANDGTNAPTQNIAVTVTNVNEAPVFSSSATPNAAENTTAVTTVVAADPEAAAVTYSITGGADAALFTINSTTGALSFLSAPNFEAPADAGANNVYDVVVTATDGTNTPTQNIAVTVTDVNEAPVFTSSTSPNVAENTTAVLTVTTADEENNTITYSITGGADAALFTINSSTGALSFLSAPNFEAPADAGANNVYDVVITANDGTNAPTQNIAVTVTDVNEAPVFSSSATPSAAENTTAVTTVVATDPEAAAVTYSITGGADAALFSINSTTGALTFNSAPNFEAPADAGANNVYDVVVAANDGTNAPTQNIAVTVTDVNEAPVFTSTATPNVAENTTAVVTVTATDQEGNTLTYTITGGADAALFAINSTTGALSFLSAPNFETPGDAGANNVYDVVVTVSDGTSAPTQNIAITVTDSNEAPVFTSSATPAVVENTTAVVTVTTTDQEGNTITYSVTGGADAALFTIDSSTGVLSFLAAPNFEAPADAGANNVYDVVVTASDGANAPTQNIAVTVTNVNEAPVFTSTAVPSVPENTTAVVTVATNDPESDTITYSITSGADMALFTINSATGALSFLAAPNFDAPVDAGANNVYDVVVTATDGTNAPTQAIAVTVTDVNEAPVFTSSATPSVAENTTAVVTVTTTDQEGNTVTYSVTGGADAALFTINSTTGALSFLSAPNFEAPVDAGANNVYDVVVTASDGTNAPTQNIAVTVTDVNEGPAITSGNSASFNEGATGTVLTATATDPEGDSVTFSITGGADSGDLSIHATTGAITFNVTPDFEAPVDADSNNTYVIQVTATSTGGTAVQTITITVDNVNEEPAINVGLGTFNVAENTTAVTTITSSDPDGTSPTYSIVGGADAADFSIDSNSGALTFTGAPNFEAPADADANNSYEVTIRASDGTLFDDETIIVNVTNVNEAPAFTSSATPSVQENTTAVVTVTTTDAEGNSVVYSITGGADSALFTINGTTGALSFLSAPDFEAPADAGANNVYDVVVTADDGTNTPTQNISVTVTDFNDPPVFTSGAVPTVPENTTAVTTVTVSDPENDPIVFSISGGADAALFTINSSTGALSFVSAPNFEAPADAGANNVYDVVVTAHDGTYSPTQALAVSVLNVSEAPAFTSANSANVPENMTTVLTVTTTDPEGDAVTYSISGGADAAAFAIDGNTGALTFVAPPNFEMPSDADANNVYSVVVKADDGPNEPTQTITVTVTNVQEPPVFTSSNAASFAENATGTVLTAAAVDSDGDPVTYSITGGTDSGDLSINSTTGAITFNATPDFEAPVDSDTNNTYVIQVTATSTGGTDVQTVTITVTNVNEQPVITSGAPANVPENTAGTIHTVTATDPDGTSPTFAIVGGADAADFNINTTTGALSFAATPNFEAPADANADNVYELTVRATDGTLFDDEVYTVTVTNVNEAPVADDEAFTRVIGNTQHRVDGGAGATTGTVAFHTHASDENPTIGDTDPDSIASGFGTISIVPVTNVATNAGGKITIDADGSFTYTPPPGVTGAVADFYDYTLTDGTLTDVGRLNFTISKMVWYVKNDDVTGPFLGTSTDPFAELGDAAADALPDDAEDASVAPSTVYVFRGTGTSTGMDKGIALDHNQILLGETQSLIVDIDDGGAEPAVTLVTGNPANRPVIGNTAGSAVSVPAATNRTVQIRGFSMSGTDNAIDATSSAAAVLDVTIDDVIITGATNEGIDVNQGSTAATSVVSITNVTGTSNGNVIDVRRTAGTLRVSGFGNIAIGGASLAAGVFMDTVNFDTDTDVAVDTVNGGTLAIGASGDGVGSTGMTLLNATGGVSFSDADIYANNGSALTITGSPTFDFTAGSGSTLSSVNGAAADLTNVSVSAPNVAISSTNSSTRGVSLTGVTGTFTASSGAITNATGTDFFISGGSANVTYGGTITDDVGQLVSIANATGTSTKAFTGAITDGDDGDGSGISLTNNSANTTMRFSGGLVLDTGANPAFTATGGGIVEVCDETVCNGAATGALINKIETTTGIALNVTNTIGANNLEFRSISSNGASSGIILNGTGTSGGLKVKGDATGAANGSGGHIQGSTSNAVSLTNTRNTSLTQLNISTGTLHGININSVTNFTYQDAIMTSVGDGNEDQGITILNLFGVSLIEDVTMDDITEDGIQIRQNATDDGTADSITIRRLNIQDHVAGFGESGVEVQPDLGSNLTVLVDDSDFAINANAIMGVAMSTAASHTGTFNMTVQASTFNSANAFGSGSIQALGGGSGNITYTVTNNQINSTKFDGIRINNDGTATTTAVITNNTITGSGATNNGEGITLRQDENGVLNATITGNNISQVKSNGIRLQASDNTVEDAALEMKAIVTGNTATVRGDGFGAGLLVDVGDGSGVARNDVCLDVSGNTFSGTDTSAYFDHDITLQLNETANASLRVNQTAAGLSTANNSASVSFFANPPNAIVFGAGPCP